MVDLVSGGLAAAGLITELMRQSAARRAAAQNLRLQESGLNYQLLNQRGALEAGQDTERTALLSALLNQRQGLTAQQQNLQNVLLAARGTHEDRLRAAGALRFDQFGNATYYDREQGRWVTVYTPQQERLRRAEQAQQERTLARGAQAAEDYAQQRAGYLYRRPEGEAAIRDEITRLLRQAQGEGERGVNTIMQRFGVRTAGNIPTVQQMDTGPSPGQQLAETALKARSAALAESQARERAHGERYLPAMAAFERTANVMPQEGTTGRQIVGMQAGGAQDILAALADYEKTLPGVYGASGKELQDVISRTGAATQGALEAGGKLRQAAYDTGSKGIAAAFGGLQHAGTDVTKAAGAGPGLAQFAALINALRDRPVAQAKGTLGGTKGATYSAADDVTPEIRDWDRRYNFGPMAKGAGGEAAPFGGASPYDYPEEPLPRYDYPTIWGGNWSF